MINLTRKWLCFVSIAFSCALLCSCVSTEPKRLYEKLGGVDGVARLVEVITDKSHRHPKVGPFFEGIDDAYFKEMLALQICHLSDGGCIYDGLDMDEAHAGMNITPSEFDAFVQLVIDAMDELGIAFGTQNQLLQRFAKLRQQIVFQ